MATPILDGLWSPLDRRQLALLRDAFVHFVEMFDALCGLAFNFGGGFVTKVAISDMFEIQSSQLALSKQADTDTKPFAEKMVQDHQKTSTELKALVEGGKVKATLPSALDAEHQKMLDDLKAKSGKDFDQSYDQVQLKAHRDAVALFEAYAKGGDNAELKGWAGRTLPHLKEHLSMAEKLK
jgi:putative membrane protein